MALLGTTGEANSFSSAERRDILEAALKAGISGDQLMPGTGLAAIPETVELTRHALSVGVTRVVMLPPFYYKGSRMRACLPPMRGSSKRSPMTGCRSCFTTSRRFPAFRSACR